MKIYTKTGDQGQTGLYGADRVSKNHVRVEAYGTVDELNSHLGLSRAFLLDLPDVDKDLTHLQDVLFDLGADLATRLDSPYRKNISPIDADDVVWAEERIDHYSEKMAPLSHFIHPAGCTASAQLHVARSVARRAERDVIRLHSEEEINLQTQIFLNRLSDFLFVLARFVNHSTGGSEALWHVKSRRTTTSSD